MLIYPIYFCDSYQIGSLAGEALPFALEVSQLVHGVEVAVGLLDASAPAILRRIAVAKVHHGLCKGGKVRFSLYSKGFLLLFPVSTHCQSAGLGPVPGRPQKG